MAGAESLKLVAHRAGYDLLFSVSDLVEVLAVEDLSPADPGAGLCGGCLFRGAPLPIPDMDDWLGVAPGLQEQSGQLLVLTWDSQPFGVLIEEVCGIFAADQFRYRDMPLMLRSPGRQCFVRLALWQEKLLLCCDAARLGSRLV